MLVCMTLQNNCGITIEGLQISVTVRICQFDKAISLAIETKTSTPAILD